jgi:hypothetical protein
VRARAAIAVIAVGALLAACGGGHTATKQDVIARANGICINALHAVREVPPPSGSAGLAAYLAKVVPIVQKEAKDTRALPRPAKDRAVLDRYVDAVTASAGQYQALASAAKNGDAAGVSHGLAALRVSPVPALAAQYGLNRCSVSAGTGVS